MLKKIKDCKKRIKRGWKIKNQNPDEIILEDPKHGRIEVVANCEGGYDQIVQIEPTGAVVVVMVDELKNKIYLHTEMRPAPMKTEERIKIKKDHLFIPFNDLGRNSVEIVRGFSEGDWKKTAIQEIKDETGYDIDRSNFKKLGYINKDTASVSYYITVVLVRYDSQKKLELLKREESRKITNRKWYKIEDVKRMIKNKKIFCAITLAALNIYFQNKK